MPASFMDCFAFSAASRRSSGLAPSSGLPVEDIAFHRL